MNRDDSFGIDVHFYQEHAFHKLKAENWMVYYMVAGCATLFVENKSYRMQQDDIIIVNRGEIISLSSKSMKMLCVVEFDCDLLNSEMMKGLPIFQCNTVEEPEKDYTSLLKIMASILKEYASNVNLISFLKKGLLYQLMDVLVNSYMIDVRSKLEISSEDNRFNNVLQYIHNNYYHHLTLKDMADETYMSVSAFSRYFKRKAGVNFIAYLNDYRLSKAAFDLLNTEKSLTMIAIDHGFTNPSMFSKAFKAKYQLSPRAYKNKYLHAKLPQETQLSDRYVYQDTLRQIIDEREQNPKKLDIPKNTIAADVNEYEEYHDVWNDAINVGQASELLSARMQKQVLVLHRKLGIRYVRIVNIFSWEMNIRQNHHDADFNFELVDNVMDFIVTNQMHPIIDFGDKPKRFLQNIQLAMFMKTEDPVFESQAEAVILIRKLIEHVVRRYGRAEVNSWIFELWTYIRNNVVPAEYDYFDFFCQAKEAILVKAPGAKVGGCGLELGGNHEIFLQTWHHKGCDPDFISICAFPYKRKKQGFIAEEGSAQRIASLSFMRQALKDFKMQMKAAGMAHIPVYITEWNMSMSDRNLYNDSCGKAAHMLLQMIENYGEIEMGAYLYASDLSNRFSAKLPAFFGGIGLFNRDDIPKPSFYATLFFHMLHKKCIQVGSGYMLTTDGLNQYTLLLYNHKRFKHSYYLVPEDALQLDDFTSSYVDDHAIVFDVNLNGIENGTYTMKSFTVGEDDSFLKKWQRIAYNREMDLDDVNYMKQVCIPKLTVKEVKVEKHVLHFSESVNAHDIRLIQING